MKQYLDKAIRWMALMLSEGDGTPSTKRVILFLSIVVGLSIAIGWSMKTALVSETKGLVEFIIVNAIAVYGVTRFAEKNGGPPPPAPATA